VNTNESQYQLFISYPVQYINYIMYTITCRHKYIDTVQGFSQRATLTGTLSLQSFLSLFCTCALSSSLAQHTVRHRRTCRARPPAAWCTPPAGHHGLPRLLAYLHAQLARSPARNSSSLDGVDIFPRLCLLSLSDLLGESLELLLQHKLHLSGLHQ